MAFSWRRTLRIGMLALLPSAALAAEGQDGGKVEFGFTPISFNVSEGYQSDFVNLNAAAGRGINSFGYEQGAFVQWFATEKLGIEPAFGVSLNSSEYNDGLLLALAVRTNYYLFGTAKRSPFVFAGVEVTYSQYSSTDVVGSTQSNHHSRPALNVGAGYRWPIRKHLSLRAEGGYSYVFDEWGTSEGRGALTAAVAVAVRF